MPLVSFKPTNIIVGQQIILNCICSEHLQIGQAVYITHTDTSNNIYVDVVDITNSNKMPASGIIFKKILPTLCSIIVFGFTDEIIFNNSLLTNEYLFIDGNSFITTIPPDISLFNSEIIYVQCVGRILFNNNILIDIQSPIRRVKN